MVLTPKGQISCLGTRAERERQFAAGVCGTGVVLMPHILTSSHHVLHTGAMRRTFRWEKSGWCPLSLAFRNQRLFSRKQAETWTGLTAGHAPLVVRTSEVSPGPENSAVPLCRSGVDWVTVCVGVFFRVFPIPCGYVEDGFSYNGVWELEGSGLASHGLTFLQIPRIPSQYLFSLSHFWVWH